MVRRVKKILSTRNICVIAHVDHGKTTLSDSFLSYAGLLFEEKAGTTLALDTDKEEIERGITIKSTGITLRYPSIQPRGVAALGSSSSSAATSSASPKAQKKIPSRPLRPDRSSTIYVGNLPWIKSDEEEVKQEADLIKFLTEVFSPYGEIAELSLRPRRGFANITFSTQAAADAAIMGLSSKEPLQYDGRTLVVERQQESSSHLLEQACKARGLASPVFTLVGENLYEVAIPGSEHCIRPSAQAATQKDAKREAAEMCLRALETSHPLPSDAEVEVEIDFVGEEKSETPATAEEDDEDVQGLIVNLIDCPGHVDFSGEVTAALRITDGALVVVDCVEGVGVQTETVLRQALAERVKPVLFLNKVDRVMGELQCSPEDAYQRFVRTIANVNSIIEMYQPAGLNFTVSPEDGTVGFGSGLHGWGFTLPQFARILLKDKPDADAKKLAARLWGDYYHDKAAGKWRKEPVLGENGLPIERTFCEKILRPIYKLHEAERENRAEELAELAAKLGVTFRPSVWEEMTLKERRKAIFKKWIPVAESLLDMANEHLPDPIEAQAYRAAHLYEGEDEDPVCQAMKACDPDGPVMVYISKLVPASSKAANKNMIAFGRVFSGTLTSGQPVRVLGPAYQPGEKTDLMEAKIQSVVQMMADRQASLSAAPAGTIIGILGIDKAITKSATLTTDPAAFPMKMMKFSVSPVVRIAVTTSKASDHTKLHAAMQRLVKYDPTVQAFFDEATGEKIIAGVGELHVEVCIKKLAEFAGVEVICKEPVVQYCETISSESPVCMAKSGNKHNRLLVTAGPLSQELTEALEAGTINMKQAVNVRVSALADTHGWDRNVARRIMAISGGNMLVDTTTGIDLSPIRELVILAFSELCEKSVLAGEPLRGVCFKVTDAKIHPDSPHRRADQIVPMAKRALYAAILSAAPLLYEPIFSVEVQIPDAHLGALRRVLKDRRGKISEDLPVYGTPLHIVKAFLPVASSFGFAGDLQGATSGHAFANTAFSHWQVIEGDVHSSGSNELVELVRTIRQRKDMKVDIPTPDQYWDRV